MQETTFSIANLDVRNNPRGAGEFGGGKERNVKQINPAYASGKLRDGRGSEKVTEQLRK